MPAYLTFALVAPLASFGGIAVGERRGGWDRPARSAVLGLVGACLGVEREDDAAQAALARDYGLAMLCHVPGRLLADYHTAQVPSAKRNRSFATRAQELAVPQEQLNTILSRRDYRSGAWHLGALWPRGEGARWPLEAIAAGMRAPVFTPYLGRKSCPLGLPLAPDVGEATDAPSALLHRHAEGREAQLLDSWRPSYRGEAREAHWPAGLAPGPGGRRLRDRLADQPAETLLVLDEADMAEGDPRHLRTEWRRDQPRSRRRWQFDLRAEAVLRGVER